MRKQRILWDMDQCLCRLMKALTEQMNLEFIDLKWTEDDIKMWNFWDHIDNKEAGKVAFNYMSTAGCFRNLEPYEESVKAFLEMDALGHEVRICTAPLIGEFQDRSKQEKYDWVEQYLGKKHADNIIFSFDKTEIEADVIVDDKPNLTSDAPEVKFKNWLIVDHAYNQSLPDDLTLEPVGRIKNDWSNWREEFAKLELI